MGTPTFKEHLRYRFDNYMSRGTGALIGGLAALSLLIILISATFIWLVDVRPDGGERLGFLEAAWESLMRTLDAGTMGGDAGWGFRLVMFAVTLGGIFIISALIGVLTGGLDAKTQELRKGRSRVIEFNHTVILGWSPQIYSVIHELALANQNQANACIVVLAEKDKIEMEDSIREKVGPTGPTRIVCRTGSPIDLDDLQIVSLPMARAIVVLSPESDHPDADVIKALVAALRKPAGVTRPYHIVAELTNPDNLEIARMVGKGEVELVMVSDLIARIVAQTCLQSGLSLVYTELLDFGGDEIYFKEEPSLVGKTFGETLSIYEDSSVLGVQSSNMPARLNPAMDTILQPGDALIVVSEDDDTILLSGFQPQIDHDAIRADHGNTAHPTSILVLGWNSTAASILSEIDHYVAPGTQVTVMDEEDEWESDEAAHRITAGEDDIYAHLEVAYKRGNFADRRTLETLHPGSFAHIILLACSDRLDPQRADALTLVTLLHLRDLADRHGYTYAIVSQILDARNRALAEVARADDFIVSDKLASLMLSQIAENKRLNAVFADLFDPEGSEIYLKPAGDYVALGQPVNFYTVVEAARHRGEVAFGYRLKSQAYDPEQGYGVVVNPKKSQMVTFAPEDKVIVLAEE